MHPIQLEASEPELQMLSTSSLSDQNSSEVDGAARFFLKKIFLTKHLKDSILKKSDMFYR